ncbi:hypothetical protein FA95DRAFT_561599 [Auriscalpium vulgare]|uniref:Uncharacterized protein n=1 Tax=Auriscalpium vulgare TaxID=40419 RepID=A0ACB8RFU9_9AGAM|nr:hypothetical protein FA95DRAFT_561599 [Auriscalpium vulgare]
MRLGATGTLRDGLLRAIASLASAFDLLDEAIRYNILLIIGSVLPRYISVYGSVIASASDALKRAETKANKANIEKSGLKGAWDELHRTVTERASLKERVELKHGTDECYYCWKTSPRNAVLRCASCQDATYCSKECQTLAWQSVHKSECKLRGRAYIDAPYDPMTRRERKLFPKLVSHDVQVRAASLLNLAAREHPNTPLNALAVYINYSQVPAVFNVFALSDECFGMNGRQVLGMDGEETSVVSLFDFAREKAEEGSGMFVVSFVSFGRVDRIFHLHLMSSPLAGLGPDLVHDIRVVHKPRETFAHVELVE